MARCVNGQEEPKPTIAQSIIFLRKELNSNGPKNFLRTIEGLLTTDMASLRTKVDEVSASMANNEYRSKMLEDIALESKHTQKNNQGGINVRDWLERADRLVSARLQAWICCCCEADIHTERLQGFRARLRAAVAATIFDDIMEARLRDRTAQGGLDQRKDEDSQQLALASIHWDKFAKHMIGANHRL